MTSILGSQAVQNIGDNTTGSNQEFNPSKKIDTMQTQGISQVQNIANRASDDIPLLEKLSKDGEIDKDLIVELLIMGQPKDISQYTEHIYKILGILYEFQHLDANQFNKLKLKVIDLFNRLPYYIQQNANLLTPKLYLIVEKNFDVLIKLSVCNHDLDLSTKCIRFLTLVIMSLNYWEIYNLLNWKPAIYHFLTIIQFNLNDCYNEFVKEYSKNNYQQQMIHFNRENVGKKRKRLMEALEDEEEYEEYDSEDDEGAQNNKSGGLVVRRIGDTSQLVSINDQGNYDDNDDAFINNDLDSLAPRDRHRVTIEPNLARKIIKRANTRISAKSSNYDPDVVHECQLSSADEPGKMCLRRFSRKYELIRHQETVHSKKKKLFKCFVCVKQNPGIGPRIFTRHDTLAKHIRVNHKISGKEAKAEVAYSKRNAEIVEEGDITVHVGRRKTKVDFELRAHMDKKREDREQDYYDYSDIDETGRSIVVDEEDDLMDEDTQDGDEIITQNTSLTPNGSQSPQYSGSVGSQSRSHSMSLASHLQSSQPPTLMQSSQIPSQLNAPIIPSQYGNSSLPPIQNSSMPSHLVHKYQQAAPKFIHSMNSHQGQQGQQLSQPFPQQQGTQLQFQPPIQSFAQSPPQVHPQSGPEAQASNFSRGLEPEPNSGSVPPQASSQALVLPLSSYQAQMAPTEGQESSSQQGQDLGESQGQSQGQGFAAAKKNPRLMHRGYPDIDKIRQRLWEQAQQNKQGQPSQPIQAGSPHPGQPVQTGQPVQAGQSSQAGQPGYTDQTGFVGQSGQSDAQSHNAQSPAPTEGQVFSNSIPVQSPPGSSTEAGQQPNDQSQSQPPQEV